MKIINKKVLRYLLSMLLLLIPIFALGFEDNLKLLVWEGYTPKEYVEQFENEIEIRFGRKVKLYITYAGSVEDFYDAIREKSFDLVTISHHTIKDERFNYIEKKPI